jgi:hypothetical protein
MSEVFFDLNFKKWQQGAVIGSGIGVLIGLVIGLPVPTGNDLELSSISSWIQLFFISNFAWVLFIYPIPWDLILKNRKV